ncbi:uncharacterized protein LOC129594696 isoform X2 [Paramacrobiotus metropolitanus]|uniref:uncharacterized protein LOC129594696 isoform X2 n=1 Tax=Paramacrobiotus metropolitanus TaxID=2943436 RepID=UPI002445B484|nr:uncharacterized protein LOC129594696 isoform X2 [Paramacrobiotus metropolitanus]
MESRDLKLVIDTSSLLYPRELQSFQNLVRQSVWIYLPAIVLAELKKLKRDPRTRRGATNALNYIESVAGSGGSVHIQSPEDCIRLLRTFYPPRGSDCYLDDYPSPCDNLILLYALELRHTARDPVWLITQDQQLRARATRSGLQCVDMSTAQMALEVERYDHHCPKGNDYHVWTSGKDCSCQNIVTVQFPRSGVEFWAESERRRDMAYQDVVEHRGDFGRTGLRRFAPYDPPAEDSRGSSCL